MGVGGALGGRKGRHHRGVTGPALVGDPEFVAGEGDLVPVQKGRGVGTQPDPVHQHLGGLVGRPNCRPAGRDDRNHGVAREDTRALDVDAGIGRRADDERLQRYRDAAARDFEVDHAV
jgi:hypothetical protein